MKQKYAVIILFALIVASSMTSLSSYQATERVVVLAVTTRQDGLRCEAKCSAATIFSMSDQKPASVLWTIAFLWGFYCFWKYRKNEPLIAFGGLAYSEVDKRFYNAKGKQVRLTPMQQQLMEMFFHNESHQLTKVEICDALWPKKADANELFVG